VDYYHHWRPHRSLDMDAPDLRPVQPPKLGPVRKLPEVGGLHLWSAIIESPRHT
jgi:hypothetical protein